MERSMKRWILSGMLILAGCLWSVNNGQAGEAKVTAKAERKTRIGVVYVQKVFDGYNYAIAQKKIIKKSFEKEKKKVQVYSEKIKKMATDLQQQAAIRGTSLYKLKLLEIQRVRLERQLLLEKFDTRSRIQKAEFYRSVYKDFRVAIKKIGAKYKFDLVITASEPDLSPELNKPTASPDVIQSEIMLRRVQFVSKPVDITSAVIYAMNKTYKARAKLQDP